MRMFAKIFLCTMIVLSVVLSLSGYLLISSSYKNAMEQETLRAMDQYHYIKFLLRSELISRQDQPDNDLSNTVSASFQKFKDQSLSGFSDGENYITIFGEDQTSIYTSFPSDSYFNISDYNLDQTIINKIEQVGDRTCVIVLGKITQSRQTVYLLTATDIQNVIDQKQEMVRNYGAIYFITIGFGVILDIIFSSLLTSQIRKMSSAAARIANGNYNERLKVYSNDEMGELSKRFNTMAETIQDRIAELSNTARQKEDFVSNFAHELKTPLTSVIGYADMIYQKQLSREYTKKAASYIMEEGLRLESLSLKLMDLIILNQQDIVLEELPADEFLQNIADTLTPLMLNRNITFQLETGKAYIRIDYDLLKSLLLNLIDNAIKAGSTEITLTGKIELKSYIICVSDNGHGIPADELDRITEAFYMVDKSRSRKQHGAGLGLAIAAKIAEIHGSRLEFISIPDKGTTVSLPLPMEGGDECV